MRNEEILPFDDMISQYILKVLRITGGRIEGPDSAERLLNQNPNTLRSKMKKLNILFDKPKNK